MKAQPCKYCESPVAHNANRCPHCGGKNPYPSFFIQLQRQQQANAADPTNAKETVSVNPAANYVAIGCTGVVVILVIIFASISSTNQQSSKSSPQPQSRTTLTSPGIPSKFEAWHQACDLVRGQLTSPSSAKFPSSSDPNISIELAETISDPKGGPQKFYSFTVRGHVDSDNSFGANIRTRFKVSLWTDGKRWMPVDEVEFQ